MIAKLERYPFQNMFFRPYHVLGTASPAAGGSSTDIEASDGSGYNFITGVDSARVYTARLSTAKNPPVLDMKAVREMRETRRMKELRKLEKIEEKKAFGMPTTQSQPKFKPITTEISARHSIFSSEEEKAQFASQVKLSTTGTKFLIKNKQMKAATARDGDYTRHFVREFHEKSYSHIPEQDIIRVPVKAVVDSLTTGIPLNPLTKSSTKALVTTSGGFRRNYLQKQQEATEVERSKGKGYGWKAQSYKPPAIEDEHDPNKVNNSLPKLVQNLPVRLKILGQSANEFYKSAENEDGEHPQRQNSREMAYEHSEPFHRLLRAMKKFKLTASIVQKLKQIEGMRLRDRAHVRKQEEEVHRATLQKMNSKVLESQDGPTHSEDTANPTRVEKSVIRETADEKRLREEEEAREREKRSRQYIMKQKKQLQRLQTETSSTKQVVIHKQQDPYSAKKAISIRPYKSYWLLCIDECLKYANIYGELIQESLVGSDSDIPLVRVCDPGYYRITLPKHSRESSHVAAPTLFDDADILDAEAYIDTPPIDLLWSEELLDRLFVDGKSPEAALSGGDLDLPSPRYPTVLTADPDNLEEVGNLVSHLAVVAEMESTIHRDIQREYNLLYLASY